jgi:signal transducing adaptor molecule
VKKKALGYIKAWAKQFEETGDSNLGLMGELYDQLRAKSMSILIGYAELILDHTFDEPEPVPEDRVCD